MEILKEGVVANPSSFLLNFTYAKERLDFKGSHKVYKNLVKYIRSNVQKQKEPQVRAAADLDGDTLRSVSNLNDEGESVTSGVHSRCSDRT